MIICWPESEMPFVFHLQAEASTHTVNMMKSWDTWNTQPSELRPWVISFLKLGYTLSILSECQQCPESAPENNFEFEFEVWQFVVLCSEEQMI